MPRNVQQNMPKFPSSFFFQKKELSTLEGKVSSELLQKCLKFSLQMRIYDPHLFLRRSLLRLWCEGPSDVLQNRTNQVKKLKATFNVTFHSHHVLLHYYPTLNTRWCLQFLFYFTWDWLLLIVVVMASTVLPSRTCPVHREECSQFLRDYLSLPEALVVNEVATRTDLRVVAPPLFSPPPPPHPLLH